ncbi:MAG: hypothetical protein SFX18_12665 [Pirellulales bacterium]|nr:hypothetical protein [Pirellulales bacterium]
MCIGIAIDAELLTETFLRRFGLAARMQGDLFDSPPELLFQFRDRIPQLPIVRLTPENAQQPLPTSDDWDLVEWGNRGNRQSRLPLTGWAREESTSAGKWKYLRPQPVWIPASRGLEKGVWFPTPDGLQGILVEDENRQPHVYMLTRASTPEYEQLTKHHRMPVWGAPMV